jgi:hypothetical protein
MVFHRLTPVSRAYRQRIARSTSAFKATAGGPRPRRWSDLGRSGGTSARREELGIAPGRSSHVRLRVRHHRTWRSWRPLRVLVRYFDCGLSGPTIGPLEANGSLNCRPQRRDRVLLSSQAWSFRGGAVRRWDFLAGISIAAAARRELTILGAGADLARSYQRRRLHQQIEREIFNEELRVVLQETVARRRWIALREICVIVRKLASRSRCRNR